MVLTRIKRQSTDIVFFGLKGSGKTIFVTYLLFVEFLKGKTIFANFHLNFPYVHIETLSDLRGMHDGVAVLDDAERVISSKFLDNKQKKDLLDGMLDTGKRNIDVWYILKRPLEADKSVRSIASKFVKVKMELKVFPGMDSFSDVDFLEYASFLDHYVIVADMYDRDNLSSVEFTEVLDYLPIWALLYDTTEQVQKIKN